MIMKPFTQFLRKVVLFFLWGFLYCSIEIVYRGFSHVSMFLLAGLLGVFFIDTPNNIWGFHLDYLLQVFISTFFCILGEGITGYIVNVKMGLNVWDYSHLFGSFFYGQCNLLFAMIWMILIAFVGIPFCDAYNYYVCKDKDVPYYQILGKEIFRFPEK